MDATMAEICNWAGTNPAERNYVEGEQILRAGHVSLCSKSVAKNGDVSFTGRCWQTTNSQHVIKGEVNAKGTIKSCSCSCKAGLGEKCKHIVAVLLYCYKLGRPAEVNLRRETKTYLMDSIKSIPVGELETCCANIINKLGENTIDICGKSKDQHKYWMNERKYRITGSTCYGLFTYINNKNADWDKKCNKLLKPKQFKTVYTEYGRNTEREARKVFAEGMQFQIIETGLEISKQNPWLAYWPDGIIVRDKKPVALLEIKCPFRGKTGNIEETVNTQLKTCLRKEGKNFVLREKHRYYGQIQLGMAVLNLNLTYFVIYSKFDRKYIYIQVKRNDKFILLMLSKLKNIYYKKMVPKICSLQKKKVMKIK